VKVLLHGVKVPTAKFRSLGKGFVSDVARGKFGALPVLGSGPAAPVHVPPSELPVIDRPCDEWASFQGLRLSSCRRLERRMTGVAQRWPMLPDNRLQEEMRLLPIKFWTHSKSGATLDPDD